MNIPTKFCFVIAVCLIVLLMMCGCNVTDTDEEQMTEPYDITVETDDNEQQTTSEQEEVPTSAPDDTATSDVAAKEYKVLNYDDVKAMWISQYDLASVYCSGSSQATSSKKTSRI